jgi:hypothetical protein
VNRLRRQNPRVAPHLRADSARIRARGSVNQSELVETHGSPEVGSFAESAVAALVACLGNDGV